MTESSVRWEEPPATAEFDHRKVRSPLRKALAAEPGRWARFPGAMSKSTASVHASKIRRSVEGWAGHQWEATYAPLDDGTYALWLRCVDGMGQ